MAGTKGEEWQAGRQRAAATQRPQCLPLLPLGTDINNMYIYIYIYTSGLRSRGVGDTYFPQGPGMAEVWSCRGLGGLRDTRREWPSLTDAG